MHGVGAAKIFIVCLSFTEFTTWHSISRVPLQTNWQGLRIQYIQASDKPFEVGAGRVVATVLNLGMTTA
jgi:hypothetical protein